MTCGQAGFNVALKHLSGHAMNRVSLGKVTGARILTALSPGVRLAPAAALVGEVLIVEGIFATARRARSSISPRPLD